MAKLSKITRSFNAGVLSLLDARTDQVKYNAGAKEMDNFIPLIYGPVQRRPGLEFIAEAKSSVAADKSNLVGFEHSVDDTYILEFSNQVIRIFRNGTRILDGVGTEDISALDNVIAHWLMNDTTGTNVLDDDGNTHDGTASVDIGTIAAIAKVGTGSFDLDGQYDIEIADSDDFSFTDNSNDTTFSIACWANITDTGDVQVLLSKWRDSGSSKEWRLSLDENRKLQLHLADTSASLTSSRIAQWKLNEAATDKIVLDEDAANHDGLTQVNDTDQITATSKTTNLGTCLDFSGAESVIITNDANDLSFGDGSNDSDFSIGAWIFVTPHTSIQAIVAKWDDDGNVREWTLQITVAQKMQLSLFDESAGGSVFRETDDALSTGWHFVVCTYEDGVGPDADAGDRIIIYVDGIAVNSTAGKSGGTYVAMENTAEKVLLGARDSTSPELFFQDKLDNIMLFSAKLTQANISALYNDGDGTETMAAAEISAISNTVLDFGWRFICATYSAPADESTAADGIRLYVDGIAVSSTATNDADYTAMQNGAEEVRIGSQRNTGDSANEKFWNDKVDEMSVYSDVLTPTEIASLYSTAPFEVTSPYLTADLFDLKFENSADVMFITHPSYEERKLSRTGDQSWTLEVAALKTGPFRTQNTETDKTITASATTGTVTLTAIGHNPFTVGTISGHEPSGSEPTSKSQTGALFRLVHASNTPSVGETLNSTTLNAVTSTLTVPKGITWDFTTNGTWGTGGPSTIVLERSYDVGVTFETVSTITSLANNNIIDDGTEDVADALYRARVSDGTGTGDASIQLSIRDTSHIGIVQITSVISSTVATGTVIQTLGSTDLTHRWSEGSFSNRRGWPIDVTISAEERLTFTGNISEPLTIWGSFIGDFTDFALGNDDDSAIQFTLVGSGQQNRIRWTVAKDAMILGTNGGEHLLGASRNEEALTPTNVKAKLQTTYGSENVAAKIVNQAVLFVQRGGKKIREFLFNFEADAHKADDLTVFSNEITGDGIIDMAFQRTPDPILWCVRTDGQLAIMNYERDQNVFSWSRIFTNTNVAGTSTKSIIESTAVIYGGTRSEDEVWVSILRQIDGSDSRTIERFDVRELAASQSDYKFLDSYITDTGGDTTITGLEHLEGQTVQVLGDGLVQATKVVASGQIIAATTAAKYQVGIGYDSTVVPMDLDIQGTGLSTTKRINKAIVNVHETIGGEIGPNASNLEDIPTGTTLFTGFKEISIPGGYSRDTDITIKQTQPLPMTVLSVTYDLGASND